MSNTATENCKPPTTTANAKAKTPLPGKEETIKMIELGKSRRDNDYVDDSEKKALTSSCNNNERTSNNV